MKVSVITPSFNKAEYVGNAIDCVMKQTLTDFEYWIVENSNDRKTRGVVRQIVEEYDDPRIKLVERRFTPAERKRAYPTAVILNDVFDQLQGEYVFYLSDDDLITPDCLELLAGALDDPTHSAHVAYCGLSDVRWNSSHDYQVLKEILADRIIEAGESVDFKLDSGQVMFRRSCLDELEKPYYDTNPDDSVCRHCDGIFLSRLSANWPFFPIEQKLVIHRRTPLSTFTP